MRVSDSWVPSRARLRSFGVALVVWLFVSVGWSGFVFGQTEDLNLQAVQERAEQGHFGAQHNLGLMYAQGQGVPQDYAEAAKWYRLAAEQGNAFAQGLLGLMYAEGRGVPQDSAEAHKWINLAASKNPDNLKARDTVAELMTPEQIAEAQRLARGVEAQVLG